MQGITHNKQAETLIEQFKAIVAMNMISSTWNQTHNDYYRYELHEVAKQSALYLVSILLNETNMTGAERDYWFEVKKKLDDKKVKL